MGEEKIISFENLEVFKRSYAISLTIHKISLLFPKIEQYGGLADQMRRSSKSICANIAEGFAKRHTSAAEFKRFLMIAFGACEEMRLWLLYARDLNYLDQTNSFEQLEQNYTEIGKMLFGLHRNWK